MEANFRRRLPVGAELSPAGGAHFRVWAPRRARVEVIFETEGGTRSGELELKAGAGGYFSGHSAGARAGTLYRFRLDGDDSYLYPDPVSRFQPAGPHGPSQIVDPSAFEWTDDRWRGAPLR